MFERQTPILTSNLPMELTYPIDALLINNPISITPENIVFNNKVTISYKNINNYSDTELYKYSGNQWIFITEYSKKMEISSTGIYALFSKKGKQELSTTKNATKFKLANPAPNPFNNTTVIHYEIVKNGNIDLAIYNLLGEKVRVIKNSYHHQGKYEVNWNGKNNQGNIVPSGLYFVKMQNNKYSIVKKITLLK